MSMKDCEDLAKLIKKVEQHEKTITQLVRMVGTTNNSLSHLMKEQMIKRSS